MNKDIKICLPPYKLIYSMSFLMILSLVRGISSMSEIGGALDTNVALLAVVFCADTYVMELQGKRWEIFSLRPLHTRVKAVYRRLGIQTICLCLFSYTGYFFFFWQKPPASYEASFLRLYVSYMAAVTVTILFWGTLSQTVACLCRNLWAGIGITMVIWLLVNSKAGEVLLGKYNIFAYSFQSAEAAVNYGWLWGKGMAVLITAALLGAVPFILKKRG